MPHNRRRAPDAHDLYRSKLEPLPTRVSIYTPEVRYCFLLMSSRRYTSYGEYKPERHGQSRAPEMAAAGSPNNGMQQTRDAQDLMPRRSCGRAMPGVTPTRGNRSLFGLYGRGRRAR